ncbi:PDZ and LIM domain protein Zasp-like isoform X2 [Toxorhynchites rutilus septentrionalis]|uniref:PDZ and LIM domain protein Zasp-like isoform X2 n=1 Tax=Toxorhynchites rutilus septentrionalis TaxID=329112 RepID=UPI00247A1D2C|nr:PDZ and LIM domain protein Zasp-like isoform X2 [Toxorhynchites rutilus septentrionalis]
MANLITVRLQRGEGQSWGFRLQGGKDFSSPLVLQRVNGGSVADQAGLQPGDALIKVNNTEVFNLRHKEAQDVILAAGNSFELAVSRGTAWRPSVTPTGSLPSPSPSLPGHITPVTKTSLAATPQPVQHIGSGHNQAAKPFAAEVNGSDGQVKSIVNKQYNTPVAMYSDETIAETLSSQAEVLAGGVLGVNFKKNERVYSPANSEVYKLLHEQGNEPEPASLSAHQQQQQQVQQHHQQQQQQQSHTNVVTRHVSAPVDKPPSATNGIPAGQNICDACDRLIVGVFVRIKDKNLHADCFKCATCGTSLKNQGYFNLNNKLYCDIHARLAALQSPPPGTNGMVPVTITKPGQKSGVQAISAALNAHANLNGRSQPLQSTTLTAALPATITINGCGGSNTQSPSHSRSSSTTSSSGYCNSSSLSPVQSNKVSPLHSRTSSENELILEPPSSNRAFTVQCDFNFPPPPPPLPPALSARAKMEHLEAAELQQPAATFGANGLAEAPTENSTDSTDKGSVTQNEYGFFYRTMGGAVVRSVFPPGGSSRYKNQNNITPKPFGAPQPVNVPASYPPVAGSVPTPFSAAIASQPQAPAPVSAPAPVAASYPPMTAPAPVAAAPIVPAAVAPAQQAGNGNAIDTKPDDENERNEEEEQVQKEPESPVPIFSWPPKRVEDVITPTATPIYVPPPETQRVVIKPVPPQPTKVKECSKSPPEEQNDTVVVKSVQSKSAPELSRRKSDAVQEQQHDEMSSEAYTATTTSTSASSEEYRMYSTQTSQPIVTYYDTPIIEMDYPFSSGQPSAQASTGALSDASYTHFVFRDPPLEESLPPSVEPSMEPEPEQIKERVKASLEVAKPQKHVEFVDYGRELAHYLRAEQAARAAAQQENHVEIEEVTEEFTVPRYELPMIQSPNPGSYLPKKIVPNPVPKQWQSKLVQALCTAPNESIRLTDEQIEEANFMKSRNEAYVREREENKLRQLEALKRQVDAIERRLAKKNEEPEPEPQPYPPLDIPRKGSVMARVLASSTTKAERFPKYLPAPVVPLPADSAPYFPPPHSMEPVRSEKISSFRVTPLLDALTTAPYTPFQDFGHEVPSQMEDMPVPSGRISMTDALATAPERPYTPFREVKFERSEMYQELLHEQPSIQVDPEANFSAFASVGGNRTPVPFKPIVPEIREEPCEQQKSEPEPEPEPEPVEEKKQEEMLKPTEKLPPYPRKDAGSEHYSLAPKRESNSPLHHPAEIPTYQRKWYNLPTQNPPHTPEPEELRQNVPLAFVDTHSKPHLKKPIAHAANGTEPVMLRKKAFTTIQNRTVPVVQTAIEDDAELAHFNNAHSRLQSKGVIDRGQAFTPSLILTKHPTTIPYYQHQLGFEEYFAESKEFDGRRTPNAVRKSPAFGPPPNPLKSYVPPSREGIPNESGLYLSMGKLQGVPWYANMDHIPLDIQQKMQEQHHGLGKGHDFTRQHRSVSYQDKPVTVHTEMHGATTVQTRSKESAMREQASAESTTSSAKQVGNALIQKRTKVVEEHEHTQAAKTIEIAKFSSKIKDEEAPLKGYVAQQTRRFSGQDDSLNVPQQLQQQQQQQPPPTVPEQYEPQPQDVKPFPQNSAPPVFSTFPSANPFAEPIVDRFPAKSARKASVLVSSTQLPRSPNPSSNFKAQFNEFMVGSGSNPSLPARKEEDKRKELTQSSRPSQPPSITSNSNPNVGAQPPLKQPLISVPEQAAPAVPNGHRASINGTNGLSSNSSNRSSRKHSSDRSGASAGSAAMNKGRAACSTTAPTRGRGVMNKAVGPGGRVPLCGCCNQQIRGPFITALGRIWCPDHFICHNGNCKRPLADIGFVEEKGDLYCEYCFEEFLAPVCSKCNTRVKGDCLNAIGKQFHPECFKCTYCGKLFGNSPFFLEEGDPYCEADWNELFTTKCFACGFPVEAGDKWVEALNNNYHSQCFNCTSCKKNLEGQSFFAKGGRPFCKNHAR